MPNASKPEHGVEIRWNCILFCVCRGSGLVCRWGRIYFTEHAVLQGAKAVLVEWLRGRSHTKQPGNNTYTEGEIKENEPILQTQSFNFWFPDCHKRLSVTYRHRRNINDPPLIRLSDALTNGHMYLVVQKVLPVKRRGSPHQDSNIRKKKLNFAEFIVSKDLRVCKTLAIGFAYGKPATSERYM